MNNYTSLSKLLKLKSAFPSFNQDDKIYQKNLEKLQFQMLRIQQGVYNKKDRVVIVFEGFDAAGKGGTIRKITEKLDPRGFHVHPIAAPTTEEQGIHWLYRFWGKLPVPGNIAIFDRSWYGRVLVEKVDGLTPIEKLNTSYDDINNFEKALQRDGITVIKIFLAITKDEQLKRFEDRIKDPYKQWKITIDDIKARKKWKDYVTAMDLILKKNNPKTCPWIVIPANSKKVTREIALQVITTRLKNVGEWMEDAATKYQAKRLQKILKEL